MKYLRDATIHDMDILFKWVNDEDVRKSAFSVHPITYEEHKKWYTNLLMQTNTKQYIYMYDGTAIGQARISITGDSAEIDYSICKNYRHMGHGTHLLHLLKKQIKIDYPNIVMLIAKVKPENIASQKAFLNTGFVEIYTEFELKLG